MRTIFLLLITSDLTFPFNEVHINASSQRHQQQKIKLCKNTVYVPILDTKQSF